MREIEVKAKISDLESLEKQFEELGCRFSESIRQEDMIFADPTFPFEIYRPGFITLRIRKENEKTLLTFKSTQTNELDAIEHELEIGDAEKMRSIIEQLGYKQIVLVTKTRRKAKYGDYEICLDAVDRLGSFVEIEILSDTQEPESAQQKIFDFLLSLGIPKENRIIHGYDTLVYLKNKK